MPVIDPSTDVGKVRLRVGDWRDLPVLSDTVIQSVLDSNDGNIPRASAECAGYILGILAQRTHRKLDKLETWGEEQFKQYVQFLQMTMFNPNMMSAVPIPYSGSGTDANPLIQFVEDWNASYG